MHIPETVIHLRPITDRTDAVDDGFVRLLSVMQYVRDEQVVGHSDPPRSWPRSDYASSACSNDCTSSARYEWSSAQQCGQTVRTLISPRSSGRLPCFVSSMRANLFPHPLHINPKYHF